MKHSILTRYEQDEDGNVIIDVSSRQVEDLYNNFDRDAPYIRRDLDQDFADYLTECARELGVSPFIIRLTLLEPPDEHRCSRIRRSLYAYFNYLADTEIEKIFQMFRRSAILLGVGVGILFLSVWLNEALGPERSVTANVFAEGLTVAAWVSLWEALAIFLIEWFPHRKSVVLYRQLATTALVFRSASGMSDDIDRTERPHTDTA